MTTPDFIVNLPTYEQVEEVKDITVNTSGMLVDIDNKKYKAVIHDTMEFKSGFGKGYLDALQESFKTKFPTLATWSLSTSTKYHLWDNIVFSVANKMLAFFNMKTLEVIHAEEIISADWVASFGVNWFTDGKYIYIRGYGGSPTAFTFLVVDKVTFKYVTVVKQTTTTSIGHLDPIVGDIVCHHGIFHMVPTNSSKYGGNMWSYRLNYDGNGKPTNFTFVSTSYYYNGVAGVAAKALWGDGNYVYILFTLGSTTAAIEKKQWNGANLVNVSTVTSNNVSGLSYACSWYYKYNVDSVRYILMVFGGGTPSSTMVFNMDTMTHEATLFSDNHSAQPTFDYENGKKLYNIRSTMGAGGVELNGNYYEPLTEFNLVGKTWVPTTFYVPMIKGYGTVSPFNLILTRRFLLGNNAWVKDGQLYLKNGRNDFAKFGDISVMEAYKEVTQ